MRPIAHCIEFFELTCIEMIPSRRVSVVWSAVKARVLATIARERGNTKRAPFIGTPLTNKVSDSAGCDAWPPGQVVPSKSPTLSLIPSPGAVS